MPISTVPHIWSLRSSVVIEAIGISGDRPIVSVSQRANDFVKYVELRWPRAHQARMVREAMRALEAS